MRRVGTEEGEREGERVLGGKEELSMLAGEEKPSSRASGITSVVLLTPWCFTSFETARF